MSWFKFKIGNPGEYVPPEVVRWALDAQERLYNEIPTPPDINNIIEDAMIFGVGVGVYRRGVVTCVRHYDVFSESTDQPPLQR